MTKEATQTLNFLASLPSGNSTVTRKDCQAILMETGGSIMARGRLYNIVAKNIGAGVLRLHLELANP